MLMPSNQAVRRYDQVIGIGIVALLALSTAFGFLFENWEFFETWLPVVGLALVIYLFYRFVLAVEYFAYDS